MNHRGSPQAGSHGGRLEFAGFSVLPNQRLLLRDGEPVRIGARAFDVLAVLAAQPGELVSRKELTAQVWPNTFVDAVNLRVHVAALRKALGDDQGRLIQTDPGRGYRLVASIRSAVPEVPVRSASTELPAAVTRLIGRDDFIAGVLAKLPQSRLVTILGPGGIGKTRVVIACAEALVGSYPDGVRFIDLASVKQSADVAAAVAKAVGIASATGDPQCGVIEHLRNRKTLLVVDNCEHVIQAAAVVIEAISISAPDVHILATSREALRIRGEWVRSLPPLPSPPDTDTITVADVMSYPATELFVERATAVQEDFRLTDQAARLVGDICRRLDGVALAIELAAAEVHIFGLAWLAAHLDDRLWILNRGHRTAVARHQTLAALLDWSYELLSQGERETLQRVAAFPGDFTLEDAIGLTANDNLDDVEVVAAISGLVAKSLARLEVGGSVTRYRLAETTRAYAHTKSDKAAPVRMLLA